MWDKLTAQAFHLTKKVKKAEELTNLPLNIGGIGDICQNI
jgi:hypothetical protein